MSIPYNYPKTPLLVDCETLTTTIPMPIVEEPGMWKKFTEHVKKSIYGTLEYKRWVKAMKLNDAPVVCCIEPQLTHSIDLHHHPITLIDYVRIALSYMEHNEIAYTSASIVDMVLRWHYEGIVCYCYLNRSSHDEFHDEHSIDIPEEAIHGDMLKLINHPVLSFMGPDVKANFMLYCPKFYNDHRSFFDNDCRS